MKYEIRNMSPRGTVPISGMIEEQMDKCLIWNQSDFLEQPLVIILVLKTYKKIALTLEENQLFLW